jgi:hypothetical protein
MLAQVVTGRSEGGDVWEVNNEERSEVGPFFLPVLSKLTRREEPVVRPGRNCSCSACRGAALPGPLQHPRLGCLSIRRTATGVPRSLLKILTLWLRQYRRSLAHH